MPARRLSFLSLVFLLSMTVSTIASAGTNMWRGIDGSGDLETRKLDVSEFQKIKLRGSMDIFVRIGDRQLVEVTLDDNLFDNLEADVRNETLHIGWDESCRPSRGCRMDIIVPELAKVTVSGAGDVAISDFHGESFEFDLSGAGDLEIDGEVDVFEVDLSGAGDIDARGLIAGEVEVSISGAGDAEVHAARRLRATVSGAGDLVYYGEPEDVRTSVSGVGDIRRK